MWLLYAVAGCWHLLRYVVRRASVIVVCCLSLLIAGCYRRVLSLLYDNACCGCLLIVVRCGCSLFAACCAWFFVFFCLFCVCCLLVVS